MKVTNRSRLCLMVSGAIVLLALVLTLFGAGINSGVDFAGGWTLRYPMNQAFAQADVEAALQSQGITDAAISGVGSQTLGLRLSGDPAWMQAQKAGLEAELLAKYPDMDVQGATVSYAGPAAMAAMARNAIFGVLLAAVLMVGYFAIRFDARITQAACFGIFHDLLLTAAVTALLGFAVQVNAAFIAALLAVACFSFYNHYLLLNRIRENSLKRGFSRKSKEEVASLSISEGLRRALYTATAATLVLALMLILGTEGVRALALPLLVGVLANLYSTTMLSGYVWAALEERRKGNPGLKAKKA